MMRSDIRYWFGSNKDEDKDEYTITTNSIDTKENISNVDESTDTPLIINKMKRLKVYTDGSALSNGKKNCCCGGIGVFFGDNDERNIHKEVYRKGVTNNQCELLAIYEAIVAVKRTEDISRIHVEFCSDSEYSIKVITKWAPKWRKDGWKKKGGDIKNLNLIKHILTEIKLMRYNFKHVKAHTSCSFPKHTEQYKDWYGNYMADQYAYQSAKNLKKRIH